MLLPSTLLPAPCSPLLCLKEAHTHSPQPRDLSSAKSIWDLLIFLPHYSYGNFSPKEKKNLGWCPDPIAEKHRAAAG